MDASDRGVLINRLADLMERDRVYLAVIYYDFSNTFVAVFKCRIENSWLYSCRSTIFKIVG